MIARLVDGRWSRLARAVRARWRSVGGGSSAALAAGIALAGIVAPCATVQAQAVDTTQGSGAMNANHKGEALRFWYNRIEIEATQTAGESALSWSATGWYGGDHHRAWWRTLGDRTGSRYTAAEAQLLYGRYVRTFWDVVVGYRRDFEPAGANYLVVGIQGIAPYGFDVEGTAFVSDHGQVSIRTQFGVDMLWTQRLLSRPSIRLDWAATADRRRASDAGVTNMEAAVQTRYEIRRTFAPYVSLRYAQRPGERRRLQSGTSRDAGGFDLCGGLWLIW